MDFPIGLPLAHTGGGTLEPLQLAGIIAIAFAYARRVRTLDRRGKPVPPWRRICFSAGVVLLTAALVSPLAHIGEELFLAHMIQHLIVGDIAALLIVLGVTGPVLQPLLAIRFFDRLRALAYPPVAFALWTISLYLWHLPFAYQAALTSAPIHAIEHASFIGFGIMMWMSLVGPLPVPAWFGSAAKLGYTFAVRLAGVALANILMWSNTVFYPDYAPGQAYWGIDPVVDQGLAGVVMMIEGGLVTLGVGAWLMLRWAKDDTERQRLEELAIERGIELPPDRAGRAAAAGQGALLEKRMRDSEGTAAR